MDELNKEAGVKADPSDVLFAKVYVPEFLKVAAAHGYAPKSEDELVEMLKIAARLRIMAAQGAVKEVATDSVIKQASESLAKLIGQADEGSAYLDDAEVKEAAARFVATPKAE